MATDDTRMNQLLAIIKNNIYGKDIRMAIHDGLEKTFNDMMTRADYNRDSITAVKKTADKGATDISGINTHLQQLDQKDRQHDQMDTYLDGRVDNIIVNGNPTAGNTELIDIRTDYHGHVYPAAGTAVRNQFMETNSRFEQVLTKTEEWTRRSVDITCHQVLNKIWSNSNGNADFLPTDISYEYSDTILGFMIEYIVDYKKDARHKHAYLPAYMNAASPMNAIATISNATIGPKDDVLDLEREFIVGNGTISIGAATLCKDNLYFELDDAALAITKDENSRETNNQYLVPLAIYAITQHTSADITVPKDPELQDLRVKTDGTTAATAGEAIRAMVSDLQRQIDALKK